MKKYLTYAIAALFASSLLALASPESDALEAKEKAAWQAFKDKKADDFKKLISASLVAVYADGILTLQEELDAMTKVDMKSFALSDFKVTMAGADTAMLSYKAKIVSSMGSVDKSGDYNCGSVWQKKNGEWTGIFHTDMKADPAPAPNAQKKE